MSIVNFCDFVKAKSNDNDSSRPSKRETLQAAMTKFENFKACDLCHSLKFHIVDHYIGASLVCCDCGTEYAKIQY